MRNETLTHHESHGATNPQAMDAAEVQLALQSLGAINTDEARVKTPHWRTLNRLRLAADLLHVSEPKFGHKL